MEDCISNLPDDVLQQILQFLPLKDVVRSSILSKRWRTLDVCCTFPLLNFRQGFFQNPPPKDTGRSCNKNVRKKNRRSLDIVDKLLRRRCRSNHNVQRFQLLIPTEYQWETHQFLAPLELISQCPLQRKLDRWMTVVAKPGLSVLDLRVRFRANEYYNFPLTTLAAAKSLKTLSLAGFQLMPLSSDEVDVSFPCLEKMSLESIVVDDSVMQKLLKGSPLLANLRLINCHGLKILKVEGLSRLKMLRIIDYINDHFYMEKIVIDAPCLRVLKIASDASPLVITMPTCPKFLEQLECDLRGCKVCNTWDGPEKFTQLPIEKWLCGFADTCRFLKHLTISNIFTVKEIHISYTLPALKTLNLFYLAHLVSLKIVAPNLEKFGIHPRKELPCVSLNASEKLLVHLNMSYFISPGEVNEQWYSQWAEFLSSFKHSRALQIVAKDQRCFVPKESRKDLGGSLLGVKSLELRMLNHWPRPFSDFIDYMLWLSPRATNLTLCEYNGIMKHTEVFIKCLYNETKIVSHKEGSSCEDCNLLELRCWRHSLKQVKIKQFVEDELVRQNIKGFFQEQVENLDFVETISDPDSFKGGLYYYYNKLFE